MVEAVSGEGTRWKAERLFIVYLENIWIAYSISNHALSSILKKHIGTNVWFMKILTPPYVLCNHKQEMCIHTDINILFISQGLMKQLGCIMSSWQLLLSFTLSYYFESIFFVWLFLFVFYLSNHWSTE